MLGSRGQGDHVGFGVVVVDGDVLNTLVGIHLARRGRHISVDGVVEGRTGVSVVFNGDGNGVVGGVSFQVDRNGLNTVAGDAMTQDNVSTRGQVSTQIIQREGGSTSTFIAQQNRSQACIKGIKINSHTAGLIAQFECLNVGDGSVAGDVAADHNQGVGTSTTVDLVAVGGRRSGDTGVRPELVVTRTASNDGVRLGAGVGRINETTQCSRHINVEITGEVSGIDGTQTDRARIGDTTGSEQVVFVVSCSQVDDGQITRTSDVQVFHVVDRQGVDIHTVRHGQIDGFKTFHVGATGLADRVCQHVVQFQSGDVSCTVQNARLVLEGHIDVVGRGVCNAQRGSRGANVVDSSIRGVRRHALDVDRLRCIGITQVKRGGRTRPVDVDVLNVVQIRRNGPPTVVVRVAERDVEGVVGATCGTGQHVLVLQRIDAVIAARNVNQTRVEHVGRGNVGTVREREGLANRLGGLGGVGTAGFLHGHGAAFNGGVVGGHFGQTQAQGDEVGKVLHQAAVTVQWIATCLEIEGVGTQHGDFCTVVQHQLNGCASHLAADDFQTANQLQGVGALRVGDGDLLVGIECGSIQHVAVVASASADRKAIRALQDVDVVTRSESHLKLLRKNKLKVACCAPPGVPGGLDAQSV